MAQLSSYDSGNPDTPETDDSVDVSVYCDVVLMQGLYRCRSVVCNSMSPCVSLYPVLLQSRGATVQPIQPKPKTPREEDFENIKLISNGAYG